MVAAPIYRSRGGVDEESNTVGPVRGPPPARRAPGLGARPRPGARGADVGAGGTARRGSARGGGRPLTGPGPLTALSCARRSSRTARGSATCPSRWAAITTPSVPMTSSPTAARPHGDARWVGRARRPPGAARQHARAVADHGFRVLCPLLRRAASSASGRQGVCGAGIGARHRDGFARDGVSPRLVE